MKKTKFRELITSLYHEQKKESRFFTEEIFSGTKAKYGNFLCELFSPMSRDSLSKITDIEGYLDVANPDMLNILSRVTGKEIDVYESKDVIDFKIEKDTLFIYYVDGKNSEFYLGNKGI